MNRTYSPAKIEIIEFLDENVITTSGGDVPQEHGNGYNPEATGRNG